MPGSPWRPERPRSWLSMRRDSWRSVPMMYRPPAARTSSACSRICSSYFLFSSANVWRAARISSLSVSEKLSASLMSSSGICMRRISALAMNSALPPSLMSVPRPAMLVAIVTAPFWPALRDDLRLLLMVLRVEDLVLHAALFQQGGELLRLFNGDGAHEDRLAGGVVGNDVVDDGVELAALRLVDDVGQILADHRLVRGDLHHVELVDSRGTPPPPSWPCRSCRKAFHRGGRSSGR